MSPTTAPISGRSRPLEESDSIVMEPARTRSGLRRTSSRLSKETEVKKIAPPGYRVSHFNKIICDKENVPFHPSQVRDRPTGGDDDDFYDLGSDGKKKKPLLQRKKTSQRVPLRQLSNEEVFMRDEAAIGDRRRRISGDHFAVEIDSSLAAPSPGTRAALESVPALEPISVANNPNSSPIANVSSRVRVYHSRKVKEQAKEPASLQRKVLKSKALQPKAALQPNPALQPSKALQPKNANSKAPKLQVLKTLGSDKMPLKERRAASPTLEYGGITKTESSAAVRKKATVTKKTLATAINIYVDQENIQPQPAGKKLTEKRIINHTTTAATTTIKKTAPKASTTLRRAVGGVSRKPLKPFR